MNLFVNLGPDLTREGVAVAATDAGTHRFRCLGRADQKAASAHGNPSRDPLKPFGDLPTGDYLAVITVPASPPTAANLRAYGPGPRYHLIPQAGAALAALHNGRFGLLIHGGPTGAPMPKDRLRPTYGCLRVDDDSIRWLSANAPRSFPVKIIRAAI